jgi:hypothetical protein
MFEPWITVASADYFKLAPYDDEWVLAGFFSDAGGGYVARWRILSGTSVREILTNDERIISALFP